MTAYVERIDTHTVRFERLLPGPIERVWAYITEADKRAKWLAGGEFGSTIGGPIQLEFHNGSLSPLPDDPPPAKYCGLPEKVSYDGVITQYDPPNLIAHTWRDGDDESEVEYRLDQQGEQVLIVVTHRRLKDDEQILGVMGGWHAHFDIFEDVLVARTPRPFWKTHTALENEYLKRLTKTT